MSDVDLDWTGTTESGFTIAPPGEYLAEVDLVEVKRSGNGDQYLSVQLRDAETRAQLCIDAIMLQGKGRGIGMAKLQQLGVPRDTKSLKPLSLTGRRARVSIMHEEYEGQPRAKVNIKAAGFKCGYLSAEQSTNGAAAPETPF